MWMKNSNGDDEKSFLFASEPGVYTKKKKVMMMKKSFLFASLFAASAAFAATPAPERPRMIIRFSPGEENPDVWSRMLPQLEKYRASCDEVWFSNGISMVSLDTHRKRSELMAKAAQELRKIGIIPSLQIQATVGHGDNVLLDNSALTWGTYVGKNGVVCKTNNCPRQKAFHKYLYEMAKIYAAWHPGSVWIDDDLRLDNHAPAVEYGGCYCKDCLAEFSKQEKHDYTREELVSACEKDAALYARWIKFGEESLAMVAAAIAKGFKEISPETRLGLQHCKTPERIAVLKTLAETSGKRSASRPGGSTYTDRDPFQILLKGDKIAYQVYNQPGYELLDQIAPEIEDFPRVFNSKTERGHQLEALFYLTMGGDSLSYYSITPNLETPEFYGEHILRPLANEAACYREIADHNLGSAPGGVGIGNVYLQQFDFGLFLIGIPFASHSPAACATLLNKTMIDALSDTELKETLKKDLILDGEAAEAIVQRGFADAIGNIQSIPGANGGEVYANVTFNETLAGKAYHLPTPFKYSFQCPKNNGIEILSYYRNDPKFPATVLLTRPDGTRVALIGLDGFQTIFVSTSRVEFLTRIVDWVSHEKLPVLTAEAAQIFLAPRVTSDDRLKSVTVINPTIGHQKPFTLKMRGVSPHITEVKWHIPAENAKTLSVTHQGKFALVTLPEMEGWQGAWIEIPEK